MDGDKMNNETQPFNPFEENTEEIVQINASTPPNTLGIVCFVLGLISFISCCFFGGVFGIPAIVLSAIQLKQKPTGLAIAGLILGICSTVMLIILVLGLVSIFRDPELIEEIFGSTTNNGVI